MSKLRYLLRLYPFPVGIHPEVARWLKNRDGSRVQWITKPGQEARTEEWVITLWLANLGPQGVKLAHWETLVWEAMAFMKVENTVHLN